MSAVSAGMTASDGDVAEQGDLLADLVGDRLVRAEHDHVGLDADAAQLLDRVLGGLRLELARGGQRGQQRHVDVQHVRPPDVLAHLADGLEERQRLDVADRAADLDDHDVRVAVAGDAHDALLDLVGDVRDDLDRAAEVVAAALLGDDRLVDAAGGDVAELGQVLVDEALVVAQVEVGLGAVVGDEDLAVLVRRHRARVDVDVRIELEDGDGEAAGLEQPPDAGGGDAFAEGGGDASGHKDILRHGSGSSGVFPMLPNPGHDRASTSGPHRAEREPPDRIGPRLVPICPIGPPPTARRPTMEFSDVVMKRRAVRRFEEGGVEREVIERIARLAQRTPSAGFSQGQRLVVVTDRARRREVARICGEEEYEPEFGPWISECAAQFIPCVSEEIYHRRYREPDKVDEDGARSTGRSPTGGSTSARRCRTIMLAAVDEGLGCGFVGPAVDAAPRRPRASPTSSPRSGSCRSAGRSPTSGRPASSGAGCRSSSSPAGTAGAD